MSGSDVDLGCPACGWPTTSRFCGRCGARVEDRPAPDDAPAPAPALAPAAGPRTEENVPPAASRRPFVVAGAVVAAVVVALAGAALLRPGPETVTADGGAGPDGSGRTSTRAVEELVPRWDAPLAPHDTQVGGVLGAYDLGDVFVVATHTELLGLLPPAAVVERADPPDGVNLGGSLDPVRWRLPAIDGVPVPVGSRLPVLAGDELLWVDLRDGDVVDRHRRSDDARGVRGGPAFAVPIVGDALLTPDGTALLGHDGTVRWRADPGPGERSTAVGAVDDVVVTQHGDAVVARDLATGEERWREEVAAGGHVGARLVGGRLVTTSVGGQVTVRDPRSGEVRVDVRVGPSPASNSRWDDGETVIVGATTTAVFVRVDTTVGIRYARVEVADGRVEDLRSMADLDLRHVHEHDGAYIVTGWDRIQRHEGGEVAIAVGDLPGTPAAAGGWAVIPGGTLHVVGVDGRRTGVQVEPAPWLRGHRPAVVDGGAVVMTPDGLQHLDLATGEPTWTADVGAWVCCPSHVVVGDTVVVRGWLQALGPDGTTRWSARDTRRTSGTVVGAVGPWLVATEHGDGHGAGRTLLRRLDDGREGPTLDVAWLTAVVTAGEGRFAAVTDAGEVVGFDAPSVDTSRAELAPSWRTPVPGDVQLIAAGGELLAVGAAGVLHLDPGTGEVRRRTALPTLGRSPAAFADGRLVRPLDGRTLEVVDLGSGDRWRRELPAGIATAPTVAGDVVYVADGAGVVHALALGDGSPVASVTVEGDVRALTVAGGALLAETVGRLHAFGAPGTPAVSSPAGRPGR